MKKNIILYWTFLLLASCSGSETPPTPLFPEEAGKTKEDTLVSVKANDENFYIGLKKGLDFIKEREVLAHEIGHILTDTANNIHISKYDEQEADASGRDLLINRNYLISLIEENEGIADACYLASHFGVSVETMQKRICEVFNLPRNF